MNRYKVPYHQFREATQNMEGQKLQDYLDRWAFDDDGAVLRLAAPDLDTKPFLKPSYKPKLDEVEEPFIERFVRLESDPVLAMFLDDRARNDDEERLVLGAALIYSYLLGAEDAAIDLQQQGMRH